MARVKLRFLTRAGRVLVKSFKSLTSAKRAVMGWRAAGGRVASSTRNKRRRRVLYGRARRRFYHSSAGRLR